MTLSDLDLKLLTELYEGLFSDRHTRIDLVDWGGSHGLDCGESTKLFHKLNGVHLIESKAMGMFVGLSNEGISFVESEELCPTLAERQDKIRRALLESALKGREEHGRHNRQSWRHVMASAGFEEWEYVYNAHYLRDRGLLELNTAMYGITDAGAILAEKLREIGSFTERWESMKAVVEVAGRRKRGHDLEDLLFELASFDGLEVDRRVRSVGEENDLVITMGFDHFIVSCKWEQEPAKAEYLDVVRARIGKRPGSNGLLVSVGGFSQELVREAESNTSLGLVVLFGRGDLERLFTRDASLASLLQERHTALVRYRRVLFEN